MRKILFILAFLLPVFTSAQYYHSPYYTEVLTDTLYLKKGGVTDKVWKMKLSNDTLYYNSDVLYLGGGGSSSGLVKTAHFVYDSTDIKNDSALVLLSDKTHGSYFKILSVDCLITLIKWGDVYDGLHRPNQTFDILYRDPNMGVSEVIGYIDSTSIQTTASSLFVSWTPVNAHKVYDYVNCACGVGCSFSGLDDPGSGRMQFDLYVTYLILNKNMTITPTQECILK